MIVEIGGTVGDIESLPFLEAIRQLRHELGRENTLFVHVTLVPWIAAAQELKTKPTQHSVKELRAIGIQPDILLCRSDHPLPQDMKEKIALFCDVDVKAVITARDVESVYECPLVFAEQGVDEIALRLLPIDAPPRELTRWTRYGAAAEASHARGFHRPGRQVRRIRRFLQEPEGSAAARRPGARRQGQHHLDRIGAAEVAGRDRASCERFDGILVPGGFGRRGVEGMLIAIRYAREFKVPYFGICLGMQTMVIEFARNVCGLDARQFHRIRSRDARSRHLQTARVERRR